jgi:hypothetical protein
MRRTAVATFGLLLAVAVSSSSASAQAAPASTAAQATTSPAQIHLGHLTQRFVTVPNGQGLVPIALADARVAIQHAGLGAQNPNDLAAMKTHANHIIHALDPRRVQQGPGSGFGVLAAAEQIGRHAELAGRAQGTNQQMTTHSTHVAASAANTRRRTDQIVALCQLVAEHVDNAADAAKLYADIKRLSDQLLTGVDANGDGQVGWQQGEGGLNIVEQHVNFMRQAAGS